MLDPEITKTTKHVLLSPGGCKSSELLFTVMNQLSIKIKIRRNVWGGSIVLGSGRYERIRKIFTNIKERLGS